MHNLSNEQLVEAYTKAKELNLDTEFVRNLDKELRNRLIFMIKK
ncbi:sporulation histidine kinase inhibitor Sda [Virgibacillus dakarensis]|uniref:Sporulation histidine kinase inhibitor Sda n=1 Tax=Lentibacillus populi TaxID=1827502 RepID=A0A9W5TX61_9BACI|nr:MULTISPECIES: sporulation histidine kinase inhibitor Sda [Bacillaceae]MBT2217777.1 sporulation histidine kinase inhibitor Sda [Virgibacillus dakarensis]MTW87131.1 sporulation histidine kinase inhibitor Sda [Virgibacillus dakarensis]GGB41958.1 hypothetical protein GCM10011409_19390 [Lentibacillus populi]